MKTFLGVVKRIKRFSEEFNVSTTLLDKTWHLFNDGGNNEVYQFHHNGSVSITRNGNDIKGIWKWSFENQSLVISINNEVLPFFVEYADSTIIVLAPEGSSEMVFLIESNNDDALAAKSISKLEQYFLNKERQLKYIELIRKKEETAYHDLLAKNHEENIITEAKYISDMLNPGWYYFFIRVLQVLTFSAAIVITIFLGYYFYQNDPDDFGGYIFILIVAFILIFGLLYALIVGVFSDIFEKVAKKQFDRNFKKWCENHPNDERKKYIVFYSND